LALWLDKTDSLCDVDDESISDMLNIELNINSHDGINLEIEVETVSEESSDSVRK
jgi:hypothetical protein